MDVQQSNPDRRVAIIIPVRNSGIWLIKTLNAILENTRYHDYKIILVESESSDGTDKVCDMYVQHYKGKILALHTKKCGITKAINLGISCTTDEDIYLTQDDVIHNKLAEADWLYWLQNVAKRGEYSLITPQNGGGTSGPDYKNGFDWVGTWAMYIPRETLNLVGLFDENFNPGPGDDIDYSWRASQIKPIGYVPYCVEHHRKYTFDHEYENQEIIQRNAKYFKEKFP